jgi:hypothetical protein
MPASALGLALADPALDRRSYDAKDASRFGESSPVRSASEEFVRLYLAADRKKLRRWLG